MQVTQHYSKPGVTAVEVLPVYPDFEVGCLLCMCYICICTRLLLLGLQRRSEQKIRVVYFNIVNDISLFVCFCHASVSGMHSNLEMHARNDDDDKCHQSSY